MTGFYSIIFNDKNYAKGFSITKEIENATGDIILILDTNLEYDPQDYNKLLKPIIAGHTEVIFGSRFVRTDFQKGIFFE